MQVPFDARRTARCYDVYIPITTYWDGWWRLTIYEERLHAALEHCLVASNLEGFAGM